MVAAHTRITIGEPSKPGESPQAHSSLPEFNSSGYAFRGIFFGVILGVFLWATVLLALF